MVNFLRRGVPPEVKGEKSIRSKRLIRPNRFPKPVRLEENITTKQLIKPVRLGTLLL